MEPERNQCEEIHFVFSVKAIHVQNWRSIFSGQQWRVHLVSNKNLKHAHGEIETSRDFLIAFRTEKWEEEKREEVGVIKTREKGEAIERGNSTYCMWNLDKVIYLGTDIMCWLEVRDDLNITKIWRKTRQDCKKELTLIKSFP